MCLSYMGLTIATHWIMPLCFRFACLASLRACFGLSEKVWLPGIYTCWILLLYQYRCDTWLPTSNTERVQWQHMANKVCLQERTMLVTWTFHPMLPFKMNYFTGWLAGSYAKLSSKQWLQKAKCKWRKKVAKNLLWLQMFLPIRPPIVEQIYS